VALVVLRAGSAGRAFDRYLAWCVNVVGRARQHSHDRLGKRCDLSLIPLNHSCVAGMDIFVGLECAASRPRAAGWLTRGGQGCTPRRISSVSLDQAGRKDLDPFEQAAVASLTHWEEKGSGYYKQHGCQT